MNSLNIYLTFEGNCEQAFNFYKSVFGGGFFHLGRYSDMPENPDCKVNDDELDKIMHISYPINEHSILMGCDTGGEWAKNYKHGNNFSISIQAESKTDADRLFKELSRNGTITMPIADTFWGSYFGMLIDQFGIQWMVSFDIVPA